MHLDKSAVFAGYRIPHPLEPRVVVRVQTTGIKTPVQAFEHALEDLRSEFQTIQHGFEMEFERLRMEG